MRILLDILAVLMIGGVLAGVMWLHQADQNHADARYDTRSELRRFQQQIMLQSAIGDIERTARGYPATVDPDWFETGDLPRNALLGPGYPWVEVAAPADERRMHPSRLVAIAPDTAQFWYNPHTGIVRARVADLGSDADTLSVYNEINDSKLQTLFPTVDATR